ncbi:recombinase family protein [Alteribacter populi]|uniref:recombinase family protein n=1 Tax=Alteribacter populi TaxID=2011011 RepID=UPI000BBA9E13|nr:recombinase family protein [Alteribacter populi]
MTVGIYVRVSTIEQAKEGYSISAQRERLKAYCTVQGWDDYKFYVDEGISAKDTNRPQLQAMLKHVEEGIIDTVLVYRLDRITRSVVDLHTLLQMFEKHNCNFKSATEIYDTTTAMGRLLITIVGSFAQFERENTGERVRMGQIEKARQGQFSAPAPFGFRKKDYTLVVHEEEKEVILDIVNRVNKGTSIRQIANYLNGKGLQPIRGYQWHIGTILSLLKNPALYGALRWLDEVVEGTHEPIISKEEFEHIGKILHSRQNFKKRETENIFIYQMKITCPQCGNRLSCQRQYYYRKSEDRKVINNSYRCQACALNNKTGLTVSEIKIDKAFTDYMKDHTLDAAPSPEQKKEEDEKERILTSIAKIEKQREKYQRGWSNELITDEEFSERMQETKVMIDELENELEKIEPVKEVLDTEKVKVIVKNFKINWFKLSSVEKREFMSQFIEDIEFERVGSTVRVLDVHFI